MNKLNDEMKDSIVKYCSSIGKDSMLVQGAGGNVSWKDTNTLWVKASGTWLVDSASSDIFLPVDLISLKKAFKIKDFSVIPKVLSDTILRPSIETLLHALMPHEIVVHVHAIEILAYLVRKEARKELREKLTIDAVWEFIGYKMPGGHLAEAVSNVVNEKNNVQVLFLESHGVVIGGSSFTEVEDLLNLIIDALKTENDVSSVSELPSTIYINQKLSYTPIQTLEIHNLAILPEFFYRLKRDWALYPDHVVFLGARPNCFESVDSFVENFKIENAPELVFIKGAGVFTVADFNLAKQVQLKCYYDVLIRQPKYKFLNVLSEVQVFELLNWNAEKYRKMIVKL